LLKFLPSLDFVIKTAAVFTTINFEIHIAAAAVFTVPLLCDQNFAPFYRNLCASRGFASSFDTEHYS